jgi:predicted HAD superfamily Cof-like phosphohydrolase
MDASKIEKFMQLAGQTVRERLTSGDERTRALGAQLLLSEVLEYVIHGLGVIPHVNNTPITEPDAVTYQASSDPIPVEMVDGLADVAYTMYWNACAFGIPLEEAFDLVCDNNLEKFVKLDAWGEGQRHLANTEWDCGLGVQWPSEVAHVEVIEIRGEYFAVGKDARGKVRKPSTYRSVDLDPLVRATAA